MNRIRKIMAVLLSIMLIFTGCTQHIDNSQMDENTSVSYENSDDTTDDLASDLDAKSTEDKAITHEYVYQEITPEVYNLDDDILLKYLEDEVYLSLINELEGEYVIDDIQTVYLSREYIEQLEYNSKKNVFFGYSLDQLDDLFQGQKYAFTLGENGETIVEEVTESVDDTTDRIIKNVLIGTGVILICVTLTAVTAGAGAPAASMILAASAKKATVMALQGAAIGVVSAGVVKGIETQNFKEAMKAAALGGSEGFKIGAIIGAISGGAKEFTSLKKMTANGLKLNDVARIQKESGFPPEIIKRIKSMEEYEIYKKAGLKSQMVNGRMALIRDIDFDYVSQAPNGEMLSNYQRMLKGYAPIDPATGKAYQLHHVNQDVDGPLAILTESEHQGNSSILNQSGKEGVHSLLSDSEWSAQRKEFWMNFAKSYIIK